MRSRTIAAMAALTAAVALLFAPAAGASIIESATTEQWDEGTRYIVTPTEAGRTMGAQVSSYNADADMTNAGIPVTETLARQLFCHVIFAADKATWNLEDWRPVVGDTRMMNTQCNP